MPFHVGVQTDLAHNVAVEYQNYRNDAHSTPQHYPPLIQLGSYRQMFLTHATVMATSMKVHYQKAIPHAIGLCVNHLVDSLNLMIGAQANALSEFLYFNL